MVAGLLLTGASTRKSVCQDVNLCVIDSQAEVYPLLISVNDMGFPWMCLLLVCQFKCVCVSVSLLSIHTVRERSEL